jgi:hypothetical protein
MYLSFVLRWFSVFCINTVQVSTTAVIGSYSLFPLDNSMVFIYISLNLAHVIFSLLDPSRRIVIGMLVLWERFLALKARSNRATIDTDGNAEL